jgi:hypothetical protein
LQVQKAIQLSKAGFSDFDIGRILNIYTPSVKKILVEKVANTFYGCENFIYYLFLKKYSKREIIKYFKNLDRRFFSLKRGGNISRIVNFIEKTYFSNQTVGISDEKIKRIDICKCVFTTKDNTNNPYAKYLESLYELMPNFQRYVIIFHQLSDILKSNDPTALRTFIDKYNGTGPILIDKFMKSIDRDFDSISLAIITGINSGLVEGGNNKLKLIERMSYGKLPIKTLEKKFVLSYLEPNSPYIKHA